MNEASRYPWALGFILGDMSGFSAKHWFDRENAIDLAFGSQIEYNTSLQVGYLRHLYLVPNAPQMPCYVGGGLFLGSIRGSSATGFRGAVGITYALPEPFDLFAELSPRWSFSPTSRFSIGFSIGFRFDL